MEKSKVIKGLEAIRETLKAGGYMFTSMWIDDAITLIKAEPKRGRWEGWTGAYWTGKFEENGDPEYKPCMVYHCSECGRTTIFREAFCPNCGALMRNEETYDGT